MLADYLADQRKVGPERLRREFDWPAVLSPLRERFTLFQWAGLEDGPELRYFGIRRLVDSIPFRLSDLRALGYRTTSSRRPVRPSVEGLVQHYLIAELDGADSAWLSLCMYAGTGRWYVLDEHRISRRIERP